MLRKLESKTKRDLLGQLFQLFLEQTPQKLDQLGTTITSGDLETAARLAHSVKGSCVNLGVTELGRLCSDMEQRAVAGDGARCSELLPKVRSEYERVVLAIGAVRTV